MADNNIGADEISLKELILLVKKYFFEVLRYWWLVLLFVGLFVGLMVYQESKVPITYTSSMTFMLNEESPNPIGAVTGVLSSFGFGGGGGSSTDKMLQIMKSRKIIKAVLLKKTILDGKEDYFANHILRVDEDLNIYRDEEETELFFFEKDSFTRFDALENGAILKLHSYLVGSEDSEGIYSVSVDELSNIFKMNLTSLSESLSIEFLLALYEEIDEYYVSQAIEKSYKTYSIIENKMDSIAGLLAGKEYALAQEMDQGRRLVLTTSKLESLRLEKDIKILLAQYGEVVKNKELSEFSLLSLTPILQPLDAPLYPIEPEEPSMLMAIIIGGFIGGFLSVCLILARRIYLDIMAEDN